MMIEKTLLVRVGATNEMSLAKIKEHIFFICLQDKNHAGNQCWVESVHEVRR